MKRYIAITMLALLGAAACRNADYIDESIYDNDVEPYDASQVDTDKYPDWTAETHGNDVAPNLEEVFFEGSEPAVQRLDLTISTSNYNAMWSDLDSNMGSRSSRAMPGMTTTVGGESDLDFTPIWVPCTVGYNGKEWYQVGVRYKGNSSLSQSYSDEMTKLSMKLDFDEFEDSYPALKNQRFYGFKQLNLNNNYNDESFMRDKVVADTLREFGIAAAHVAFCEVYLNGSFLGLYSIVEEVDDTVIKTQFTSGGNCYKPEDDAGSFKSGTYDTDEFYLKTNLISPDYSDVQALYSALHGSNRTSNATAWKSTLEAAFDVDGFLKWLAANTAIQNWDVYGNMAHNYYLYNDPEKGKLVWIPWDHNEALQSATGNYTTFLPTQYSSSMYTGTSWPLYYYLLSNSDYYATLINYIDEFINGCFEPTKMQALYEKYETLLQSSADLEYSTDKTNTFLDSSSDFTSAVSTLKNHVESRYSTMESYCD